jgi:hypothetical protein
MRAARPGSVFVPKHPGERKFRAQNALPFVVARRESAVSIAARFAISVRRYSSLPETERGSSLGYPESVECKVL